MLTDIIQSLVKQLFGRIRLMNDNVDDYDKNIREPQFELNTSTIYVCLMLFFALFIVPHSALVPTASNMFKTLL